MRSAFASIAFIEVLVAEKAQAALGGLWSNIPVQRCMVHKQRNLLAPAPKALRNEVKADDTDRTYAENAEDVRMRHKAFLAN